MTDGTVSVRERFMPDGMQQGFLAGAVRIVTLKAGFIPWPYAAVGFGQVSW